MVSSLTNRKSPGDLFYKLYKDKDMQKEVSYLSLTSTFKDLKFGREVTFYVKKEKDI
jgi:hypothetical protein